MFALISDNTSSMTKICYLSRITQAPRKAKLTALFVALGIIVTVFAVDIYSQRENKSVVAVDLIRKGVYITSTPTSYFTGSISS
jgi:hypothetical protein